MNELENLLYELGISKVTLSKYLGVSRQMIYNYLDSEDLGKIPRLKKIKLFRLLNIKSLEDVKNIQLTSDYIEEVEDRLKEAEKLEIPSAADEILDFKDIKNEEKDVLLDIISSLKQLIADEDNNGTNPSITLKYLYDFIKGMNKAIELRYWLAYVSKTLGMTNPSLYDYDQDKQVIIESILYSAMGVYNDGGASKSRIEATHRRFILELEQKNEERLSRTHELTSAKIQALRELNYTQINIDNANEVLCKIAEIESRRI